MALEYGFYSSLAGDRTYGAEQFSAFLDGIVNDGVYSAIGQCFEVGITSTPNQLRVGSGRAWFNRIWSWNTTDYILEPGTDVPEADPIGHRIDAVVLEVNKDDRTNYIKVIEGTDVVTQADYDAGTRPKRPKLLGKDSEGYLDPSYDGNVFQYALAYIARPAGSTAITEDAVVNVVGSAETPMVSALSLAGLPSGGKTGQVLAKSSPSDGHLNWYDVTNLPFDKWYLTDGLSEDNVIAAYLFINQLTQSQASINVNDGVEYALSANSGAVWDSVTGFMIPATKGAGLNNATLVAQAASVQSAVLRFSDRYTGSSGISEGGLMLKNDRMLAINGYRPNTVYYNRPIFSKGIGQTTYYQTASAAEIEAGVYGINFSAGINEFFVNGAQISVARASSDGTTSDVVSLKVIAQETHADITPNLHPFKVQALVLYNTPLTAAQHAAISENIRKL